VWSKAAGLQLNGLAVVTPGVEKGMILYLELSQTGYSLNLYNSGLIGTIKKNCTFAIRYISRKTYTD